MSGVPAPQSPPCEVCGLHHLDPLVAAVGTVLRAADALCDDTCEGGTANQEVCPSSWSNLAEALDELEALIPEDEQPATVGVMARVIVERETASLRGVCEDQRLFIRAMLSMGSYWRVNTSEFCHRGVCHSLKVVDGVPQLTEHLRERLRSDFAEPTS